MTKHIAVELLAVVFLSIVVFLSGTATADFGDDIHFAEIGGETGPDLIVADPEAGSGGEVYVLLDPTEGNLSVSDADMTLTGEEGSRFGSSVSFADLNDDNLTDLIVGAPGSDDGNGTVFIFLGPVEDATYQDANVSLEAPVDVLGFGATVQATEVMGDSRPDIAVASIHRPDGNGLVGSYFDDIELSELQYVQVDDAIDFDWGLGAPANLSADTFSIRWTGLLYCEETGEHTFWVDADDAVRVWIDGERIIDEWGGASNASETVYLLGGYHDIRVEYADDTLEAHVNLNWTTPYSSGPVPSSNLYPSMSYPLSLIKGKTNLSNLGVSDILVGGVTGCTFGSEMIDTEEGLVVGQWSTGHVFLHDPDAQGTTETYYAYPKDKGSADETGEPVSDLWGDDNDYYEVENGNSDDDLEIDTFSFSQLPWTARKYGEIESVKLRVRYSTDQYYVWQGNGDLNYVQFAIEGDSYTDLVQPTRSTAETLLSGSLSDEDVDTFGEIEDLNIHFNNGDRGSGSMGQDSVYFEYLLVEVEVSVPVMTTHVQGPTSFGMSLASSGDELYVGAPHAGPFTNDLELLGKSGGGSAYSFDMASLPDAAAEAEDVLFGTPGSEFGTAMGASGSMLAIGAPGAFPEDGTGAVFLAEDMGLAGSGLCPYGAGNAGSAVTMNGSLLASGNPATGTVHLVDITDAPTLDVGGWDSVYAPSSDSYEIDISSVDTLNVTSRTIPGWDSDFNGSEWIRMGAGSLDLDVDFPMAPGRDTPISVIGRGGDGLICGLDVIWIRSMEVEYAVGDLHVLREDGEAFASPEGGVSGEVSTIRPFVGYNGPGSSGTDVTISTGGEYMNRTVPFPSEPMVLGDNLTVPGHGVPIWRGADQMGSSVSTIGLPESHYSWRVVVNGSYLLRRGDTIRLRFYTPVDLAFDQVSIAVACGDDRNVFDATLTEISFAGDPYYEASAGEVFHSDWTDFTLDTDAVYAVSFHTQTRGTNGLTYLYGTGVGETYYRVGDSRSDRDWSDDAPSSSAFSAYLVSIEDETYPRTAGLISMPGRSTVGWNSIGWDATVPEGTTVRASIRTADDVGGMPANWTEWHGPPGEEHYLSPSAISISATWVQYRVELVSTDGRDVPVLHSFQLGTVQGDRVQEEWTTAWSAEWGVSDFAGYDMSYPVDTLWEGTDGHHNITVTIEGVTETFMVEMEPNAPTGTVHVNGRVSDIQGYALAGATISLTNLRTGDILNTTSNGSGDYSIDLTGLGSGYIDGDVFMINGSHMGSFGSETFPVYSVDGDGTVNLTLELEGLEVFIELQDTPFGPKHIRMYRESDGVETEIPVEGEGTLLTARVGNRGQLTATNVTVGFFDNGSIVGTAQVLTIGSGDVMDVQQWWTPSAGWTNLSIRAWGMRGTEHYFWADLWDSPFDWGSPVDFTTEAYNTPDDLNTFGINGTDANLSNDGWDWRLGAYGVQDSRYVDFADPGGDADETAEGQIEIQIGRGGGGGGGMSGHASGAWGTQFIVEQAAFDEWSGGVAMLSLEWSFSNWDNNLEERASVLGRLRRGNESMWLGDKISTAYVPNSSAAIYGKNYNENITTDIWNQEFTQDVSSFFNQSGHYYLDLGLWLDDTTRNAEGATVIFDDISLEFVRRVGDQFPENDGGWSNVTILPEQPSTPFNVTVHFIDNYNETGFRVNFTAYTDSGSWSLGARTNGTGHYHIGIPAINYTETDVLNVKVDDVVDGVRFLGSHDRILYSYESPASIVVPLFSYGFNMTPVSDHAVMSPGESFNYTLMVNSDSNVGVDIYLNFTGLPEGWKVRLSGDNVNRSGGQYSVWIEAFTSVPITANLSLDEDPLDSLPGNYTWKVTGGAWFQKGSVTMTTDVIPVYSFEIVDIDAETIDPGETLFYNITISSTGNVDNVVDFNLSVPDNWTAEFPNTALPIAASGSENLVFTVAAPEWPGENMTEGVNYTFHLIGASRYSSEVEDSPLMLEIGAIREIVLEGSDMTCEPGVPVFYPINITNRGNVVETVNLSFDLDPSIGNVSGPLPFVLEPGEWQFRDVMFVPASDYLVSTAGRVLVVNASHGDGLLTMRFTVEQVHDIIFTVPEDIGTVIGQETDFEITVENHGNGDATFRVEVSNGLTDTPLLDLAVGQPGMLGVTMTPDSMGWSNVTVSLLLDSVTVSEVTVPIKVERGYIDFVMGSPIQVMDNVTAYDISPSTGDMAYISGGMAYYLPENGSAFSIGTTNATDIAVTELGSTFIALAQPETVTVHEISGEDTYAIEETWNMSVGGTVVELDSSHYTDDGTAVYMIWIAPGGVKFRSLSNWQSRDWNPVAKIWSGNATAIDIMASGSRINLAWGASNGVYYERVSYLGSEDIAEVRVADGTPPTSVALSNPEDVHLAWSSKGVVHYATFNGSWSSAERIGEGDEVSGSLGEHITSFAITGEYVSIAHPPNGFWQASERGAPRSPSIAWNDGLRIYHLEDRDLLLNEVPLPPVLGWGEEISVDVTLHNRGSRSMDVVPGLSLHEDWDGDIDNDHVSPGDKGAIAFSVRAPFSVSSAASTDVVISLEGVEMARIPAVAVGEGTHEIVVEGTMAATPGETIGSELTFVNVGNSPENITIEVMVPQGWDILLDSDSCHIPAGATVSVGVTVTAPADLTTQDDLSVNLTYAGNTTTVMASVAVEPLAPEIVTPVDVGTDLTGVGIPLNATVHRADTVTWYLPDGSMVTGAAVTAVFTHPGNASVLLVATNDAGMDSIEVTVVVGNRPPMGVGFETGKLKAGESLTLVANGTDPEGTDLTFTWRIEGKDYTGTYIDYRFEDGGTYKVILTATDGHGGTTTATHNVVVTGGDDVGVAGMDVIDLALVISLLLLLLILIVLLARRRKAPDREKTIKDESMYEMVHRLWPQYVDTVRDLDPMVADILEEAKVLNYDETTNVLTLGLEEGEKFKKAVMPEVLEVMERGFHDLHGTRVFLFIESGGEAGAESPEGPRLTLVTDDAEKPSGEKGRDAEGKPRRVKRTRRGRGGPREAGPAKRPKGAARRRRRPGGTGGGGSAGEGRGSKGTGPVPVRREGRSKEGGPKRKVKDQGKRGSRGPLCLALLMMTIALIGSASGERLTLADVDSDGSVDVVAGFPDEDSVGYAVGPLSRGGASLTSLAGPDGSGFGYAVASANGTLAIMAYDDVDANVYLYSTFGSFDSFDHNVTTVTPSGVNSLAVGDHDDDGEFDLAVASTDGVVMLYHGPSFGSTSSYELPGSEDIALFMEDVDGAGGDELIVGVPSIGMVFIFEGSVDYGTEVVTADMEDMASGVNLSWEDDGLMLEELAEIENGDGSDDLSGWSSMENRDGNENGVLRLLDGNIGDWKVSPHSGSPTVGFGSNRDDMVRDGAQTEYSGILCSPSFEVPDDVEYLHVWYRYVLESFDRWEGVYIDVYNDQDDAKLVNVHQRRFGDNDNDYSFSESEVIQISNFQGYTVYLGGELDGDDGRDSALITMDDIYFSDRDGNLARKSEGHYTSSKTRVAFNITSVVPIWDAKLHGEVIEIRARASSDVPWADIDPLSNRVQNEVGTPGPAFEFNVTLRSENLGISPVLNNLSFQLLSGSAATVNGRANAGFGSSIDVSTEEGVMIVGSPAYFSRGAAMTFDIPDTGESLTMANSTSDVATIETGTGLGTGVALVDLDGNEGSEVLVSAPAADLRSPKGGAIFGFAGPTGDLSVGEPTAQYAGMNGLGAALASTDGVAAVLEGDDVTVIRGWHAFDLIATDGSSFPNNTITLPVSIENHFDAEQIDLDLVLPEDWTGHFEMGGPVTSVSVGADSVQNVSLVLSIPETADDDDFTIVINGTGGDGIAYWTSSLTVEVFMPDMFPRYLFMLRGDGRNVTDGSRHLIANETANVTLEYYTISESPLPATEITFFEEYDTGSGWDHSIIGNVTVTPVPDRTGWVSINWTPTADGEFYVGAEIDPQNLIQETDEDNTIRYGRTVIDEVPDANYSIGGVVYDTDNTTIDATITVTGSGGFTTTTSSDDEGRFNVTIDMADYLEGEVFWVNASLGGPPGTDNESLMLYSEDGASTVDLHLRFDGVDVSLEPFEDATGTVNISVLRFGDGAAGETVVVGLTSTLEIEVRNRGTAATEVNASFWTSVQIGSVVRVIGGLETERLTIPWTPGSPGAYDIHVDLNASMDLFGPNDLGSHTSISCIPHTPTIDTWINGTVLDTQGSPLAGVKVPLMNVDMAWTNNSITTNSTGRFSGNINLTSYHEGDRIDLNVTDGGFWANTTLYLYSYDGAHDITLKLRRYGVSLTGDISIDVAPWTKATYMLNLTSTANFQDNFTIVASGVPTGWDHAFLAGNGTMVETLSKALGAGEWTEVQFIMWTDIDPRLVLPETYDVTVRASMESHPVTYSDLEVSLNVIKTYNFTMTGINTSRWVMPEDTVEFEYDLSNNANGDVMLLISAFTEELGVELDHPTSLLLEYGDSETLVLEATAPPLSSDILAGSGIEISLKVVALNDSMMGRWAAPVMTVEEVVELEWSGTLSKEVTPGEEVSFDLVLANVGNAEFSGNVTIEDAGFYAFVSPDGVVLGPGNSATFLVSAVAEFEDEYGDPLPSGSSLDFNVTADNVSAGLSLISLPWHSISISSLETSVWSHHSESQVFEVVVTNEGNVAEDVSMLMAGQNASWAELSSTGLTVGIGEAVSLNLTLEPDGPGICELTVFASSDNAVSNALSFYASFDDHIEQVLLYSSASIIASDANEFASSGAAVLWSNSTGIYVRDDGVTHFLGEGSLPAIGTHGDDVGTTWTEDGKVFFASSTNGYTPREVTDLAVVRMEVAPGPVRTIAVDTGLAVEVLVFSAGNWTGYQFPRGEFALIPHGDDIFLLLINSTNASLRALPDGEVVEEFDLDGIDVVLADETVSILGEYDGDSVLIRGGPGNWTTMKGARWGEAFVSTELCHIVVGYSDGDLILKGDCGRFTMPMRPTWPLVHIDQGYLPPAPTSDLGGGDSIYYISSGALFRLPLDIVVRPDENGDTLEFIVHGTTDGLEPTILGGARIISTDVNATTGVVSVGVASDPLVAGDPYPLRLTMTGSNGSTNDLGFIMVPGSYVTIELASIEGGVMPGAESIVEFEVFNNGTVAETMAIGFELPEGWSTVHEPTIHLDPGDRGVITVNFSLPSDTTESEVVLFLTGTEDIEFPIALEMETPPPTAVILSLDEIVSGRDINFIAEAGSGENWTWTFGDGTVLEGKKVRHGFDRPGEYLVTLTVLNAVGVDRDHKNITVTNRVPEVRIHQVNDKESGSIVQLKAPGTMDPDGTVVWYNWTFSDGGVASGAVVSHRFATTGVNEVTLTVTDDLGGVNSTTMSFNVTSRSEGDPLGELAPKIGMGVGIIILVILIVLVITGKVGLKSRPTKKKDRPPAKKVTADKRPPVAGTPKRGAVKGKAARPRTKVRKAKGPVEPKEKDVGTIEARAPVGEHRDGVPTEERTPETTPPEKDPDAPSAFVPMRKKRGRISPTRTPSEGVGDGTAKESRAFATRGDNGKMASPEMSEGTEPRSTEEIAEEPEPGPGADGGTSGEREAPPSPPGEAPSPVDGSVLQSDGGGSVDQRVDDTVPEEGVDESEISKQLDDLDALMKKLDSYSDEE